jgi:hypothetical protein
MVVVVELALLEQMPLPRQQTVQVVRVWRLQLQALQ